MKRIVLCLILIGALCSLSEDKGSLLIGTWKAVKVDNHVGQPCNNFNENTNFILKISKDQTFELNDNNNRHSYKNGNWKIDGIGRLLTLVDPNRPGKDSRSLMTSKYPIISISKDSLIIRYNYCCPIDTCDRTSGVVTFIKER